MKIFFRGCKYFLIICNFSCQDLVVLVVGLPVCAAEQAAAAGPGVEAAAVLGAGGGAARQAEAVRGQPHQPRIRLRRGRAAARRRGQRSPQ